MFAMKGELNLQFNINELAFNTIGMNCGGKLNER